MSTDTVTTDQPVIGGGIRTVNFFNGRLLTGEDLTREQQANGLARLRLGRAIGDGVAHGFEVTVAPGTSNVRPVVRVTAGLAVNREGRALELPADTELRLTRERPGAWGPQVLFTDCAPLQPGTYVAGAGVYLLTVAPAARNEGRAPVSGLGNEDAACNVAFSVEGVQFHLLRLALPPSVMAEPDRLRNRLAHLMLGTGSPERAAFDANPLGPRVGRYGLLDDLRTRKCLDDRQVPLAVLSWTSGAGIRFVDLWAVRRRIAAPDADDRFPTLVGTRRRVEAEAAFLQFQGQIGDLLATGAGGLAGVEARERFAYLPPVGMVPITGPRSAAGFSPTGFFGSRGSDELATIDAALVPALVEASFAHDPIDLASKERIQRYVIWENETGPSSRRVLLFARRTLPYSGIARYGRARFGRSRFAPSVI